MVAHRTIGESLIILFLADVGKLARIPIATGHISWLKISMSIQVARLMLANMAVGNV